MLRADLRKAKEGMTLALPVPNPNAPSRHLLKAGYALTEDAIKRVGELGVRSVWVDYPNLGAVDAYLDPRTFAIQQEVVTKIASCFDSAQGEASAKMDFDTYTASVQAMVGHVASNPKTAVFIGELSDSADDLIRHASSVTYLAVLLGLKLESYLVRERKHVNPARAKDIVNLGTGAMLHDLGMTMLDEEVVERFKLEADETDDAYREHPALGFKAVRGEIDPSAATIVLHHHQRCDGSGFAGADFTTQQGKSIHVFARIVAVADFFDRMRHPMNLPDQPTAFVLKTLLQPEMRQRFDPEVLRVLYQVVPPYAPGCRLKLNDGRLAVALEHNIDQPCRPMIQLVESFDDDGEGDPDAEPKRLDLATQPETLYVVECDDEIVADSNFTLNALKQVA